MQAKRNLSLRIKKGKLMENKRKILLQILLTAAGLLALLLLAALWAYRLWEEPPSLAEPSLQTRAAITAIPAPSAETSPHRETPAPEPTEEPLQAGEAIPTARQDGVYTILLVGNDNGNGNTDTLLLGKLDTKSHSMDIVSIPRDTLINTSWRVRRINTVYWGARYSGADGIAALKTQVERLTGFPPDCVAVIDLQIFVQAVDLIGGIWFDVPMAMDYEDAGQDLYIHLQPGYQLLDGYQAMGLCRYRSGYITGDLGRIEMQQQFLRACADQMLSLGNVPKARELVTLLSENLDTDLSAGNMAFLLRQFLACAPEDVRFHLPPCDTAYFSGCSYVLLQVEPWLELVNAHLSPYETPVGWGNVDIVYLRGTGVGCTASLRDPDYYKPEPAPIARPEPAQEPEFQDSGGAPEPWVSGGEQESPGGDAEIVLTDPEPTPAPSPEPTPPPEDGGPIIIVAGA